MQSRHFILLAATLLLAMPFAFAAVPTLLGANVTGANLLVLEYSEAVNTSLGNYSDLTVDGIARTITGIEWEDGSQANLTFDGAAATANATGTIDITGVESLADANDVIAPLDDEPVGDGQAPSFASVGISSNNTASAFYAKVGDEISIFINLDEPISLPSVVINGTQVILAEQNGDAASWVANYTFVGGETEGLVTFIIDYNDTAGNAGTQATEVDAQGFFGGQNVTFDETAPIAELLTPANNSVVNNFTDGTVTFDVDENLNYAELTFIPVSGVDANASHRCVLNGTALLAGTNTVNLNDTANGCYDFADPFNPVVLVNNTVYDIHLDGEDLATNAMNTTALSNITYLITSGAVAVNANMSVSINTPANNSVTNDTTPQISFSYTDGPSATANYTVYVNGSAVGPNGSTTNNTNTSVNLSTLAAGTYTVMVGAVNGSRSNNSTVVTFTIDLIAPNMTDFEADNIDDESAELTLTTAAAATCRYDDADGAFSGMTAFTSTGGTTHTVTVTGLDDGTEYTYFARCTEASGNFNSVSVNVTFETDVASSNNNGGGGGGGGGAASATKSFSFTNIEEGKENKVTVNAGSIPLKSFVFTSDEDVAGKISFTVKEVLAAKATKGLAGAYKYFDVNMPASLKNAKAVMTIEVPRSWLSGKDFGEDDIIVWHHDGSNWEALSTNRVSAAGAATIRLEATTPGFSSFAVAPRNAAEETAVPTTPTTPTTETGTSTETPAAQETETTPPAETPTAEATETPDEETVAEEPKKKNSGLLWFVGIIVVALAAIGFLAAKKNKN